MISDADAIISKFSSLPKLVIFDLDKTIWDVYAAEQTFPPYRRISNNEVFDSLGNTVRSYKDVPVIMQGLNARGVLIALASLSPSFEKCDALLSALDLKKYVARDLVQIRQEPSKLPHFRHIQTASKVPPLPFRRNPRHPELPPPQVAYDDMLFFDDLLSNVRAARGLGIAATQVPPDGMCRALLQRALAGFADRRRSQAFLGRWLAGPTSAAPHSPGPAPPPAPAAHGGGAPFAEPAEPTAVAADRPLDDDGAAAVKRRRL